MGQIEVYEWLKKQALTGNTGFFCVNEVMSGLKDDGMSASRVHNVRGSLLKLECHGYLESKMSNKLSNWRRLFRLKIKYVHPECEVSHNGVSLLTTNYKQNKKNKKGE